MPSFMENVTPLGALIRDNTVFQIQTGYYPYRKRQIFNCYKNFKFDENGRKFCNRVENTAGKGEFAHYKQFLLFPLCFQKNCTADM